MYTNIFLHTRKQYFQYLRKRIYILSLLLLFMIFQSSCLSSTEALTTVFETENKPHVRWMVHSGMKEENGTDIWVAEFEKRTGIELELEIVSNNDYAAVLELAFASNRMPDLFDINDEERFALYANQHVLADLTAHITASDFYAEVTPALWESIRFQDKLYGVPLEEGNGSVTYIRKDWLDRLSLPIPTNYEEFLTVLCAFRDEIPECRIPYTAPGLLGYYNLPEFYQDAVPSFLCIDGVWVDGMMQENMKDALRRLQDAYANGLLDVSIVTNKTSACRDQWYSGCVGVFNYWAGQWSETLTQRLQVNIPVAQVLAMDALSECNYYYLLSSILCISSSCPPEKIDMIYRNFFEYMHDGADGQILFQSGVEDVHWKQEDDYLVPLPALSNPNEYLQKVWITPWMAISPLHVEDKKMVLADCITDSLTILDMYGVHRQVFPYSKQLARNSSSLSQVREELIAKIVMGDLSVEDGLSMYREEAVQLGVDRMLEEMNEGMD